MRQAASKARLRRVVWAFSILIPLALPALAQPQRASSSVVTVKFQSKLVEKLLPYNVVLPPGYSNPENSNVTYPVLYLLHGLSGHYSDWAARTKLTEYASSYQILIVTPEGNDGWYTDSVTKPEDKYETYIVQELIPDVQRRFRVSNARQARAIAGLSMGGFGALKLAVKHPELFAFAGSMSGALEAATWREDDVKSFPSLFGSLQSVFGDAKSSARADNDIFKLYENLSEDRLRTLPFLYLDCGTEDPFLTANQKFSALLLRKKIPHELRTLPGKHGWVYWDQQVIEVLRTAARNLSR